jgi:hypothetical protein
MKINNPKSMVDFTRSTNKDSVAYNLATVGQLYTIANKLTEKFEARLAGKEKFGDNTGVSNNHGFAWLNKEGKLDTTLLPALAITETHVVSESELFLAKYGTVDENGRVINESVDFILQKYLEYNTKSPEVYSDTKNLNVQKGDILVVHPGDVNPIDADPVKSGIQDDAKSGLASKEYIIDDQGNHITNVPHPRYSGSYIVYDIIRDEETDNCTYKLVKISYTDGNIVKINGVSPSNSAGELHLVLSDILKEQKYFTEGEPNSIYDTARLRNTIYRLAYGTEGDEDRFYFIDKNDTDAAGVPVPYAKLQELNDAKAEYNNKTAFLSGVLSTFIETTYPTDMANVISQIDTTSGLLSSTMTSNFNTIYKTIGSPYDSATPSISAAIYPQLKQLRAEMTSNLNLLNATRCDTNDYLRLIADNVQALHTNLNGKSIRMETKTIKWEQPYVEEDDFTYDGKVEHMVTVSKFKPFADSLGNVDISTDTDGTSVITNADGSIEYARTGRGTVGYRTWSFYYNPRYGYVDGAFTGANGLFSTSQYGKNGIIDGQASVERILAVFDGDNDQIFPDVKYITSFGDKTHVTKISIDVEVTSEDDLGSLVGQTWSIYVAKTIIGIPNTFGNYDALTFAVGAGDTHHDQLAVTGGNDGSGMSNFLNAEAGENINTTIYGHNGHYVADGTVNNNHYTTPPTQE